MMILYTLGDAVRRKARATVWSIIAGIFLLVGLGFLTSAFWMVLSELRDPLFAAQVLGGGFFGIGLIFLGISWLVGRRLYRLPPTPAAKTGTEPIVQMIEGFLLGLNAGRSTRGTRRSDRH
ncbi:hypothetical protein DU478_10385 [Thalassococcus profundi]|uniref:Phage holin family protein n=1 Tax=Thalassococcus profundi TaxID=2282382 RepID=A0A369TPD9_9RHOB|nr:hypothetical protein [Thalassococcus profundi]RDD66315.1 hypothetical protein DU478_10385 [Thalassococcus profundi]